MSKVTKQAVKHTGKARKEVIVAELVEKMDQSNGLVFTDYKGITHIQLENLKKDLKTMDSTIIIAKNSLLMLSMKQSKKYADIKDIEALENPTATLFIGGDMVEPLKKLQKTVKEIGLPKIKFGILEGSLTDGEGVMKIAALPSRETLIAQFVGTLNSPIHGLVVTLNGTIQKFVMTLDAVAKSKPAGAVPSMDETNPSPTPAPAAEPTNPTAEETTSETPATEELKATEETTPSETFNETEVSNEKAETASESADETSEVPSENSEETTSEEKSEGGEN